MPPVSDGERHHDHFRVVDADGAKAQSRAERNRSDEHGGPPGER